MNVWILYDPEGKPMLDTVAKTKREAIEIETWGSRSWSWLESEGYTARKKALVDRK